MDAISHTLNIATLAAWLSVAGFGMVGLLVPDRQKLAPTVAEEVPLWMEEVTIGGDEATSPAPPQDTTQSAPTLPVPPDLPPLAEATPLPEIPDLPRPQVAKPVTLKPAIHPVPAVNRAPINAAKPGTSGTATLVKPPAPAPGLSSAARLAAGHMPAPSYPAEARRNRQTGTVIVEFTVDASGHVIAAFAKSASPWPLLNAEAVHTVRSWNFPPGAVMKLQRPIVFQLR